MSECFDFSFDPFCVGDISTVGFMEELVQKQVNDAIDYIRSQYGAELTKEQMKSVFCLFDIDYFSLPAYLQSKFDNFNIID